MFNFLKNIFLAFEEKMYAASWNFLKLNIYNTNSSKTPYWIATMKLNRKHDNKQEIQYFIYVFVIVLQACSRGRVSVMRARPLYFFPELCIFPLLLSPHPSITRSSSTATVCAACSENMPLFLANEHCNLPDLGLCHHIHQYWAPYILGANVSPTIPWDRRTLQL